MKTKKGRPKSERLRRERRGRTPGSQPAPPAHPETPQSRGWSLEPPGPEGEGWRKQAQGEARIEVAPQSADIPQWLTVEAGLYGLLVGLGLALRLWDLGHWPLSRSEADVSYQAWLAYRNLGGSPLGHSPLVFNILVILDWVFGSSDTLVRLSPALVGTGLVILPVLLRPPLGRWGALFAAAYLSLSPGLVFFSRQVSGESFALLGTLALLAVAWRYLERPHPVILYLGAAALAVGLLSSGAIYVTLAIWATWLAGQAAILRWRGETMIDALRAVAPGLASNPRDARHLKRGTALMPREPSSSRGRFDLPWSEAHRRALIVLASLLVLLSTGGLVLPAGLQAALELVPSRPVGEVGPGSLELLLSYEPAALLLGLIGLGMSWVRRSAWSVLVSFWFAAGLVLYPLALGTIEATPHLVLPLVLLSTRPIETALTKLWNPEFWVREGCIVLVSSLAWVFLLLQWSRYTLVEEVGPLLLAGVSLGFLVSLFGLFGVWKGWARAARVALLFLLIVLGGLTARASWQLNHIADPTLAERLRPVTTSPDVHQLVFDLEVASNLRTGQRQALEIGVRVDDPRLRWYLRDFENVRFGEGSASPALVTALGQDPGSPEYLGQRYRLEYTWGPLEGTMVDWARWYLYREAPRQPQGRDVMLWLLEPSGG